MSGTEHGIMHISSCLNDDLFSQPIFLVFRQLLDGLVLFFSGYVARTSTTYFSKYSIDSQRHICRRLDLYIIGFIPTSPHDNRPYRRTAVPRISLSYLV